jgi:hypothetical protein
MSIKIQIQSSGGNMTIKWLQSKVAKVLYGALLGLILSGLLGGMPTTVFASCSGDGCIGQDPGPNGQNCSGNSTTQHLNTPIPTGYVELRYSISCNAKWAKTTNTSGLARYTAATSWWPPYAHPANLQYSVSSASVIANNLSVYTAMLGPDYPVQACGKVVDGTKRIPVPIAQSTPNYCSIFG